MAEFEKTSIDETINNFIKYTQGKKYKTIYADPPWQFQNRTGKVAPEHKRLNRYPTMKLEDIMKLPVGDVADENIVTKILLNDDLCNSSCLSVG